MARKPTRRSRAASKADIEEIHRILADRKEWLEKLEHTCSIQFRRIAQIQAELDEVRRARPNPPAGKKR